jgi:hypothetical protein
MEARFDRVAQLAYLLDTTRADSVTSRPLGRCGKGAHDVQPQPHLERDAHRLFLDLLKRGAEIRKSAKRARDRAKAARGVSEDLAHFVPKPGQRD